MPEDHKIILGLHLYQPERSAAHKRLAHIKTDPLGINWTQVIGQECYKPLADQGVLEKASFSFFGSLKKQLDIFDKDTSNKILKFHDKNGLGDPFIHPILPDLSDLDKRILIRAGRKNHRYFWAPEAALDTPTLSILSEYGYQGVICAPEQIEYRFKKDIGRPVFIEDLKIRIIPFSRRVSNALAFEDKSNADTFFKRFILPELKKGVVLGFTDGETFGHHAKEGDKFITYLLNKTLPENGVEVMSINDMDLDFSIPGKLIERSSWSCPHGDLARWHEGCPCHSGNPSWKTSFYRTFEWLNDEITRISALELDLKNELYIDAVAQGFGKSSSALVSSKVSSLKSRVSCGTFFDNPHTSGNINLLFGYEAIEYLRDSHLIKEAQDLEDQFRLRLSRIPDPKNPGKTVLNMLENLLKQ